MFHETPHSETKQEGWLAWTIKWILLIIYDQVLRLEYTKYYTQAAAHLPHPQQVPGSGDLKAGDVAT